MTETETKRAVVIWPVAHTFDDPADFGSVQTQLRFGAAVRVLHEVEIGGMCFVQVRYGWGLNGRFDEAGGVEEGWLEAGALTDGDASESARHYLDRPGSPGGGRWLQVAALEAHGFVEPSRTSGPSVVRWPNEAWLLGVERTEVQAAPGAFGSRWWRVSLPVAVGGVAEVFVQEGDVAVGGLERLDAVGSVAEAMRMIGRPYVWGGASSFGWDCSGLVQMAARRRGVALPHSARRQFTGTDTWPGLSRMGEDLDVAAVQGEVRTEGGRGSTCSALGVEFAERAKGRWGDALRPGDFLYFAMGGKRVDHVGLWAGDGAMVHASSSQVPVVRREPFWGSVYAARMLGVRRVG